MSLSGFANAPLSGRSGMRSSSSLPSSTRSSDDVYAQIRGVVRAAERSIGVEESRLALQAEQRLREGKKQWDAAERQIRAYIARNPERALMIATGVGVAIGVTLASMRRR